MKLAILTALVAAVYGEQCQPAKISYEIYKDHNCKHLDKEATEQYKEVPKIMYKNYHRGCHPFQGKYSYRINCNDKGVHTPIYKGTHCRGYVGDEMPNGGKINYQWNTCEKMAGQDIWFVIRTTQIFKDHDGPQ